MIITNELSLPAPFVAAATSDHVYKPRRYSVTELLRSPRETLLARRHDAEIKTDASDLVWSIFGTAVHKIIQESESTDAQTQEVKLTAQAPNGYTISGIFDLYDKDSGTITDWKTASIWKVVKKDYDDWYKQVTAYAWLLRQNGEDPQRAEIVMMLKDFSLRKSQTDREYPAHPVQTVSWLLPRFEITKAGDRLIDAIATLAGLEDTPDAQLPLCSEESRWHTPDKWAVMEHGKKRAVKLHDTEAAAQAHAESKGAGFTVEYRPGEDNKCLRYCAAREFCEHYRVIKTKED